MPLTNGLRKFRRGLRASLLLCANTAAPGRRSAAPLVSSICLSIRLISERVSSPINLWPMRGYTARLSSRSRWSSVRSFAPSRLMKFSNKLHGVHGSSGSFLLCRLLRLAGIDAFFHRVHGFAGDPACVRERYASLERGFLGAVAIAHAKTFATGRLHDKVEAALTGVGDLKPLFPWLQVCDLDGCERLGVSPSGSGWRPVIDGPLG